MREFTCSCGRKIFFENTLCLSCGNKLAYDYTTDEMYSLENVSGNEYSLTTGKRVKLCHNYYTYNVCNVCIPINQASNLCLACQLNETIPNLTNSVNLYKWAKLENAKRRLVRTLVQLQLCVLPKSIDVDKGMAFAFLEDQQMNPQVEQEFVSTGHCNGLITVNLAEADDALREHTREMLGEQYRTPLGHLRHESGHYYFEYFIKGTKWMVPFHDLFGDTNINYQQALNNYYSSKPHKNWETDFISEYAMVHPLEDWAECWAHYLHMVDTLETAHSFGAIDYDLKWMEIDQVLDYWSEFTVILNELNRSMGLKDAYPFVLSSNVIKKLSFVHQAIDPSFGPIQREVAG